MQDANNKSQAHSSGRELLQAPRTHKSTRTPQAPSQRKMDETMNDSTEAKLGFLQGSNMDLLLPAGPAIDCSNHLHLTNAAIECNNIAAELLRAGNHHEALETSKWAAQLLYPVSQALQGDPFLSPLNPVVCPVTASVAVVAGITTVREAQKKLERQIGKLPPTIKREHSAPQQPHAPQTRFDSSEGFANLSPMTLDMVDHVSASCSYEAAVILFNMGLSYYHFHDTSCQTKALCLFEMAFSLGQTIVDDHRSHQVAMGSLNNAAFLYHELGSYQLSRYCLDLLAHFIFGLPPASSEDMLRERHEYLLNVVLLQKPNLAAAA